MTPFETYKTFLALKAHFTQPSYDYVKYHGKVNADHKAFERRRDKYQFYKLSKHKDVVGYLVANFVNGSPMWVGDLLTPESEQVYADWLRRQQSLTYLVSQDIATINGDLKDSIIVPPGEYPTLLKLYKQKKVSAETIVALNKVLTFFPYWNKKIQDPVIWPSVRDKLIKYDPFVHIDYDKVKKQIKSAMV